MSDEIVETPASKYTRIKRSCNIPEVLELVDKYLNYEGKLRRTLKLAHALNRVGYRKFNGQRIDEYAAGRG